MLEVISLMATPGHFLLINMTTSEVIVTSSLDGLDLMAYFITTTDGEPEDILNRYQYAKALSQPTYLNSKP